MSFNSRFTETIHRNPLENVSLLRQHHRKQASSQGDRMLSAENLGPAFAKLSRADGCIWRQCTAGVRLSTGKAKSAGREGSPLHHGGQLGSVISEYHLPQNSAGKLLHLASIEAARL